LKETGKPKKDEKLEKNGKQITAAKPKSSPSKLQTLSKNM